MKMTALALVCQRLREEATEATPSGSPATICIPSGHPKPYFHIRPGAGPTEMDKETVGIQMYLFDPDTLLPYLKDPYFQPHLMLKHTKILEVPSYITWTNRQRGKVAFREIPELISNSDVEKAVRLAKYVSFKMHGKVMKETFAGSLIAYYRNFFQNAPFRFES
jgi:hypothetical protein